MKEWLKAAKTDEDSSALPARARDLDFACLASEASALKAIPKIMPVSDNIANWDKPHKSSMPLRFLERLSAKPNFKLRGNELGCFCHGAKRTYAGSTVGIEMLSLDPEVVKWG
jgi:hypothetical protein